MIFLVEHVVSLAGLVAVVLAAGLPLARLLGCAAVLERLTWGVTLGLLALAQALLLIGALGLLRVGWLAALVVFVLLYGGRDLIAWSHQAAAAVVERTGRRVIWVWLAVVVMLVAPLALAALYPPHAFDETLYHLVFARAFAQSAGMPFVEYLRAPVFPPLNELLDAALLLLADDISTHWISWIATLATAGLLVVWSREQAAPGAGGVAAALHLGTPMVVYLSGVAYVDPLLTLWVTAALAAWRRAIDTRSRAWRIAAGVCAGSAASVKYLALFFIAWLALEALLFWPDAPRRRIGVAIELLAAAGAASLPVYLRIALWTGNPLFPFYPGLFGSSLWSYEPAANAAGGQHLLAALQLPWRSVFARASVGAMPPLSPFWLLALALAIGWGAWRLPQWRGALTMAAIYVLVIPANSRYLLPILPVTGLAGVSTLFDLAAPRALGRRRLVILCLALLLPGWLYAGWLCARRGPLPLDARARDTFLEQSVPGYRAVEFLNRSRGASYTAYGLNLESLAYHARGRWLGDWSGPARFDRLLPAFGDAGALTGHLRALGAEYLVLRADAPVLPPHAIDGGLLSSVYDDGEFRIYALNTPRQPSP